MSRSQFRRDYQLDPITLVQGIAQNLPSGRMSILVLTEGSTDVGFVDESRYFAQFRPAPGGTLLDFGISEYPFASMAMAANAVVQNARSIAMIMDCPARTDGNSYPALQAKLTGFVQQLTTHILKGGTFDLTTPGYIYEDCLLRRIVDVTPAGDKKVQQRFQLEFYQPLITQQAAAAAYNNLYNKLANGLPVSNPPRNSGVSTVIGNAPTNQPQTPPSSGVGPV